MRPRAGGVHCRTMESFESGTAAMLVVGADGRLLCANQAAEKITGYSATELVGQSLFELTHPGNAALGHAVLAELLAGGSSEHRIERPYVRKDGSAIWTRVTMSTPAGIDPPVVVVLLEDISASRAAEHALGDRERELAAIHQVTQLLRDASHRDDRLRDAVALLPSATQHPSIASAAIRWGARVFETPRHRTTPWMLTAPFQTSNGERGEVIVAYHEDRAAPGKDPFLVEEAAMLATIATIIEGALDHALALEGLRQTNAHLNLAIEAAGMAVWEWNLETDLVRWSQHLADMTGVHGPLEAPFLARSHVVHPDDRPRLAAVLRGAAERRDAQALEVRLRRPDGGWREVLVCARGDRGRTKRVIAAVVDVSIRHALEEELRQAQKVEALGQVASGVAHDFNNLLSVITTGLEYLGLTLPAEGPSREVIDDVLDATRHAVGLTRQLLAFSRSGEFQPAAVDVSVLLSQLEPMLVRLAGDEITLQTDLDENAGSVWADASQLEQVVMNLVVNARDAMGGRGVITVSTSTEAGFVVITVRDTGPGIPPELQARVFEPFFTTKQPGNGTGLGLALVARVARQWQGRVEVVSAPGEGATFRFLLPRLDPAR
jgi:two-component system, cell cycle sensor histidine kinase and response regulator CckA